MLKINFYERYDQPIVVALGFFDCIHKGHKSLIERAVSVSKEYNCESAVFTFDNDISTVINKPQGVVYTFYERLKKLEKLSVNTVIFTSFTKDFSLISPNAFLDMLFNNFRIKAVVCGLDYKFGFCGKGDVDLIKQYCKNRNVKLFVEDEVTYLNKKISTSDIKEFISLGEIEKANLLLGEPYFICGLVEKGRQVGRTIGFPTANIQIPKDKTKLRKGVYKTHLIIDGKRYSAITNYGARPTYGLDEILTETHVVGFCGDLYGKEITVCFDKYLRDCVKFDSEEKLKEQLQKDLVSIND